jgi:sec-independent protein translocase protein TatC
MSSDAAGASPEIGRAEPLPEMSLLDHLTELRRRLVISMAAFLVAMLACWAFSDRIYDILTAPVVRLLPADADRLAFLSLTEPFILYLKVAAVAGLFVASPIIIYQAWMFVAPGLYRRERLYAIPVVIASAGCFLLGGLFGYRILFPIMADFFLTLGADFRQLLTVNSLFSFLLRTLIGCALIFEWPIVVFFMARLGLLTARGMWNNFRYAILIIFIVAAVVTPTPDFATQTILAMPMLLLYLLGIVIAWAVEPRD